MDPDGRNPWAISLGLKVLAGTTVLAGAVLTTVGLENTGKSILDAGEWINNQTNNMVDYITPDQNTMTPFPITQGEGIKQTTIAPSDATNVVNSTTKLESSPNEKHGDDGRAQIKAEKQIQQYVEQLKTAKGSEKIRIKTKIRRVREDAERKKKGEEHSKVNKR